MSSAERTIPEAAIWQDVEFGAYSGDLTLWEELVGSADGAVLEIGAGTGRVSLHLARKGHDVIAIEADEELTHELIRRWRDRHGPGWAEGFAATAADITAPGPWLEHAPDAMAPTTAIAPLHVIQQISPEGRAQALANVARMLPAGGIFAVVVVDESSFLYEDDPKLEPRPPDMREVGGWIYASEPLWLQVQEDTIRVRRLRRRVAPDGETERTVHDELLHRLTPDQLEEEARTAGLSPAGRRNIASEPGEADSIAVLLEVPDGG